MTYSISTAGEDFFIDGMEFGQDRKELEYTSFVCQTLIVLKGLSGNDDVMMTSLKTNIPGEPLF